MTNFIKRFLKKPTPIKPLPTGIHHYKSPPENPLNYRLHLRLETEGNGLLVINASTILHLNETAAEYAYYLVHETPEEEIISEITSRYNISRKKVKEDYIKFNEQIETLINTPDLDPASFLDIERHIPFSDNISAPGGKWKITVSVV